MDSYGYGNITEKVDLEEILANIKTKKQDETNYKQVLDDVLHLLNVKKTVLKKSMSSPKRRKIITKETIAKFGLKQMKLGIRDIKSYNKDPSNLYNKLVNEYIDTMGYRSYRNFFEHVKKEGRQKFYNNNEGENYFRTLKLFNEVVDYVKKHPIRKYDTKSCDMTIIHKDEKTNKFLYCTTYNSNMRTYNLVSDLKGIIQLSKFYKSGSFHFRLNKENAQVIENLRSIVTVIRIYK